MWNADILYTGFYGFKNTGDDAFVDVSAWGAKKYWGIEKSTFLSNKRDLPITTSCKKGYPFTIPRSYHLQNILLLRNAQYLISAGGSTINSKKSSKNIKSLAVNRKLQGGNIKLGAIGVSIGPFKTKEDEQAVAEYLKHLDFLAVRDRASYKIASDMDLPYQPINAFDLAALLPKVYAYSKPQPSHRFKKVIGISVCPYESICDPGNIANEQKRNAMLCELLNKLDHLGNIHFKFLIINGHPVIGDELLTKETIMRSGVKSFEVIQYQRSTKLMWDQISDCDFVISTRLHAAIFACFADVPFMLNEYHRKCGDFLDTVGYESSYRLYDSDYMITQKAQQILQIIDTNYYLGPSNKDGAIVKAEHNFTMVRI